MSLVASRAALRATVPARCHLFARRNASSASEVASAAKAKTAEATSKASEGLSRVTSSAGSALMKAGSTASSALGKIGGRTGRAIGFVQSLVPPTIYYSKVGLELGKIIFESRKMSPPSMATFQSYFQPIVSAARNPTSIFLQTSSAASALNSSTVLNRVRNLNTQQYASAAVVTAEVIGFFSVGEMLGRFKVVGYRSSAPAHH